MDLKYLNTFKAVVEEGSFVQAAVKLNYTQSTITFQIGQLEQELSAQLFERIGRRMVLTRAGEQLIPYIDDVLGAVERMQYFHRDLKECQGDLHIGVGETLLCYQLSTILKEFHKQAPKARLFLRSQNCYEIRDELLKGTLDLGLFYKDVGGFGTNLTAYTFGKFETILVASPEVKRNFPDFRTPGQQILIPFIINEPNCVFRQMFEDYLNKKSIRLEHTIELWSIPSIKNLVKSDVGVSFLPAFAVQEELECGELSIIETDISDPHITAVCGHHKNKWVSPLMQLFLNLCREYSSKYQ